LQVLEDIDAPQVDALERETRALRKGNRELTIRVSDLESRLQALETQFSIFDKDLTARVVSIEQTLAKTSNQSNFFTIAQPVVVKGR
jgi:predicted  nucleic acid-binding Zn-ribbon protein